MRNNRFESQYIVNVTKQLIGSRILSGLASDRRASNPQALYLILRPQLKEKIRVMKSETLGLICEFGYTKNFSLPLARKTGFIRMTGIADVHPAPFASDVMGRALLEEIALCTIIAVATDIARQSEYEAIRDRETEDEELFDRGMAEYVHRGPNARQL